MRTVLSICTFLSATVSVGHADPIEASWKMFRRDRHENAPPSGIPGDAKDVKVKDKWRTNNDFWWVMADLTIPARVKGTATAGRPLAIEFGCAAGGDIYVDGELQARYDNDHPALVLLDEAAQPGRKFRLAALAYGQLGSEGESEFSQAEWVLVNERRARQAQVIRVAPQQPIREVPEGLIGLSQGGGMADYEDATAEKLRQGGFRWFRMDNVLTSAVRREQSGRYVYDFADLEKRVRFMRKVGAEPVLCASYMPEPFDAVPDPERHSAPRDYRLWEELCYRAARHLIEAGLPVRWWEVWNEANSGWLKPGPGDAGSDEFQRLYREAMGKPADNKDDVRLLEAYCKLYAATAAGVRRADPTARVGGPCLASGPYEQFERGHAVRGRLLSRGLFLYCREHDLPLDFVSWHEYFHPADVFADEIRTFRRLLSDFPSLERRVQSWMITEWSFSWWADRPQDHEMAAAWAADGMIRAILPERIDRPCWFYVKDNDENLRGSYALLIRDNVPKPAYHVCRMFNSLRGSLVRVAGADDELAAVAAYDEPGGRLAVIVVNWKWSYNLRRKVRVEFAGLPVRLKKGTWRRVLVDATHSNVWHDRARAELETVETGRIEDGPFALEFVLRPSAVTMIELTP